MKFAQIDGNRQTIDTLLEAVRTEIEAIRQINIVLEAILLRLKALEEKLDIKSEEP